MASEKDNLGQKLHDAEAALENQWARQQDAELLEQIRKKWTSALHCLKCGRTLQAKIVGKAQLFACPEGHGAWLDEVTLDSIHKS
jgi:hypothetical protein